MEVDAFRLRHLANCVATQAQDREVLEDVFRRVGLSHEMIEYPNTVDRMKEPLFVIEACRALQDPAFGARAGLQFLDVTTLASYIAKYSKNLRRAIENSSRYYCIVDPALSYSVNVSGNAATFRIVCKDPAFTHFHQYKELILFTALARCRNLTKTPFQPIEMRFEHEPQDSAKAIGKLAGCPVVFGAENTEMILQLTTMDLMVPTYDPSLRNHLIDYGEKLLKNVPNVNPSLSLKTKAILLDSLPGRMPPAHEVASRLGMSKRTFARRLGKDNSSFRAIVDAVRRDLAKVYLRENFSIAEIAFSLDYADQAAFSTAFKRWVGCSPKEYRTNPTAG